MKIEQDDPGGHRVEERDGDDDDPGERRAGERDQVEDGDEQSERDRERHAHRRAARSSS